MNQGSKETQNNIQPPGSPQPGEPVYLAIGKFRRPHGVAGEMLMEMLSDFPERFRPGKRVYLGKKKTPYTIAAIRPADKLWLVSLKECTDRTEAEILTNQYLYVETTSLKPLPEGQYYHYQVIGMQVFDEDHRKLGTVEEILTTGANDVYIIKDDTGKEVLIPAIKGILLSINTEAHEMTVRLPEWE